MSPAGMGAGRMRIDMLSASSLESLEIRISSLVEPRTELPERDNPAGNGTKSCEGEGDGDGLTTILPIVCCEVTGRSPAAGEVVVQGLAPMLGLTLVPTPGPFMTPMEGETDIVDAVTVRRTFPPGNAPELAILFPIILDPLGPPGRCLAEFPR